MVIYITNQLRDRKMHNNAGDMWMLLYPGIWKVDDGKVEIIPFVIQMGCKLAANIHFQYNIQV
jgi:hypothetical protein